MRRTSSPRVRTFLYMKDSFELMDLFFTSSVAASAGSHGHTLHGMMQVCASLVFLIKARVG